MTRRKAYTGLPLDPARAAALDQLHSMIQTAVEDGNAIPCMSADADLWISETRADQHEAADRCVSCPLMLSCRAYVQQFPEETVMGGELPTPPRRKSK